MNALVAIAAVGYILLAAGTVVRLLTHVFFVRRIKRHYPKDWHQIGSPTLLDLGSFQNARLFSNYMKKRQYAQHGDVILAVFARIMIWTGRVAWLGLVTTAVFVLFYRKPMR